MKNILSVEKIEKYYGNKGNITKAIDNISFKVGEGEFVGIMGPSGSGKTTLLNCISTIDKVTTGNIIINDQDITRLKSKKLDKFRQNELGFIFQDFNLLDTLTAYENIALALTIKGEKTSKVDSKIKEVAKYLEIEKVLDKYPYQMSGGQKQRAFIAMSLAQNTEVLLLDEPTTYLDIYHQIEILEVVKSLNEKYNITIVMVLHDLNQAINYSHNIVIMKNGNLIKQGKATEVLNEQTIKDVYNVSGYIHKEDNEEIYFIPKQIC